MNELGDRGVSAPICKLMVDYFADRKVVAYTAQERIEARIFAVCSTGLCPRPLFVEPRLRRSV